MDTIGSVCILVCDDSNDNFAIVHRHLTNAGYAVDRAVNGKLAVAAVANADERYELVLMDVEMPEMDGFEATRAIRALEMRDGRRRVPIVALTAHDEEDYRARCQQAGCDGYLVKPIRKQALLEAVAGVL